MSKTILDKMEDVMRRPVPYEGLERASSNSSSDTISALGLGRTDRHWYNCSCGANMNECLATIYLAAARYFTWTDHQEAHDFWRMYHAVINGGDPHSILRYAFDPLSEWSRVYGTDARVSLTRD